MICFYRFTPFPPLTLCSLKVWKQSCFCYWVHFPVSEHWLLFPLPLEAAQEWPWEEGRRILWLWLRFGSWDARALLPVLSSVSMRLRANCVTCFPKCSVVFTQCTMSLHPVTASSDQYQTNDFHWFYINFSKWPHPYFEGKTCREGNYLASYGNAGFSFW